MRCKHCNRLLQFLGNLALTDWYRCHHCHHEVIVQIRDEGTYQQQKEANALLDLRDDYGGKNG
jgi:hypothetical protein